MVTALLAGLAAGAIATIAEARHARRVERVARLAFAGSDRPPAAARLAPVARVAGLALAVFGATLLLGHDPLEAEPEPNPRASRQLLVVLDASPSMNLSDAGPGNEKEMRGVRAGKVLRGILDRLDMQDTRVSLVAFYTKALPILRDSTDKELVANLMDGLPLYTAFAPGETDLGAGIAEAFEMAKGWARGSTTLVVLTDGDLSKAVATPAKPAAISDVLVIGVGDPNRATAIAGHASRQDQWTLKSLAARLGGVYHDGNRKHLPNAILDSLAMISPRATDRWSAREIGLAALGTGAALAGLATPLLLLLATPRARREAAAPDAAPRARALRETTT
ncbi:MAG: hypothetical protein RI967_532 [Planctomycetota bacterium]